MRIIPYRRQNDLRPLGTMLSLFDDFFNSNIEEEESQDNFRAMAMDIYEQDKEFVIKANLPGYKKENVKISVNDNQLHIEAGFDETKEEKQAAMYRCERYSGSYRRNLLLPENADVDNISATMEDGVLSLNVPKKEPTPKKEITIG